MAGTTTTSRRGRGVGSDAPLASVVHDLIVQFNAAIDDLETIRGALSAGGVTLVNQLRQYALYRCFGNPGLVIDTNFDVKNGTAIYYTNGGTLKTLSANTNFDTGTSATIATTKWGVAVLTVTSAAATAVTWFTNAGAGYADEATAIAAITAPAATSTVVGYVTVQAAGATWTAGTDALQGGTGGTAATTTTYYNNDNPNATILGAAATATTVDTAGDLVAAKIGDSSGVAIAASS